MTKLGAGAEQNLADLVSAWNAEAVEPENFAEVTKGLKLAILGFLDENPRKIKEYSNVLGKINQALGKITFEMHEVEVGQAQKPQTMEEIFVLSDEFVKKMYGDKIFGQKKLHEYKKNPKLTTESCEGIGIGIENQNMTLIKTMFLEYLATFEEAWPVMVRSSHPDERPGKYESHPTMVDPKKPEESWKKLQQQYFRVIADEMKAVKIEKLDASKGWVYAPSDWNKPQSEWEKNYDALGVHDRSFFARYPGLSDNTVTITAVSGMGVLLADEEWKHLPGIYEVDIHTGEVVSAISVSNGTIMDTVKSRRQDLKIFFDITKNRFETIDPLFSPVIWKEVDSYSNDPMSNMLKSPFFSKEEDYEIENIELNELIQNINGIKEERNGQPFEIEGVFKGGLDLDTRKFEKGTLKIHQLRTVLPRPESNLILTEVLPEKLLFKSDFTVGFGNFEGDLFLQLNGRQGYDGNYLKRFIDKEKNYMMATKQNLHYWFWQNFKDPKVRLCMGQENILHHNMAESYKQIAEGRELIYMQDWDIKGKDLLKKIPKDRITVCDENFVKISGVKAESNGRESQIFLI